MEQTEKIMKFFLVTGKMEKQIAKLKSLYMKKFGLNGSDLPILFVLMTEPEGCRQDRLSAMTGSDKAQISRSISRLMDKGMISKEDSSLYKSRYSLTEKGRKAADDLAAIASQVFDEAHSVLDDEQWEGFYDFLERLNSQIARMIEIQETQKNSFKEE